MFVCLAKTRFICGLFACRTNSYTHYDDVIMTMLASQITSLMVVYSIVYLSVNQRKHQSSASLAFVWEIHRGPVNFPHKRPVTRKMFPFDDVIMLIGLRETCLYFCCQCILFVGAVAKNIHETSESTLHIREKLNIVRMKKLCE